MERGGGRESVAVDAVAETDTVSQRRVAMEVAGLAVWCAALRRTKLTDEQVPLFFSASASALPLEQGSIGSDHQHRPNLSTPISQLCALPMQSLLQPERHRPGDSGSYG